MKRIMITLLLLFIITNIYAQTTIEEDIINLMKITGSGELGIQVMESLIEQFKQMLPFVPTDYWDKVLAEVSVDELISLIVPIYVKHFTHEEIKELIAFYNTPVGKKLIEKTPLITEESMTAGQEWGMKIAEKIQGRLTTDGYLDI